jgi:heat-inducible transcriptional repressor
MAIIQSHIATAEPVGSRTISKKYNFGLSPATIRNTMSDLEEMGLLTQPHASAGRIPTDLAYRIYVDNLDNIPPLSKFETDHIDQELQENLTEFVQIMETTSKVLSFISKQAGLVFLVKLSINVFKHIEFIRMRPNQALAIFVTESGLVHNKIIELDEDISQDKLDNISRYLNHEFAGITLREIRNRVQEMMRKEKEEYDLLLKKATQLSQRTFSDQSEVEGDIYLGGTVNILEKPEFAGDIEKMKALFKAFEEKDNLIKLLDKCMEEDGIRIVIGSESMVEGMQDCSLVTHTYKYGDKPVGTLGIIGPKRMEYPRIIAIVDYTAKAVSRLLSNY